MSAQPCIRYVRTIHGNGIRAVLIYDVATRGGDKLSEFDPYHLRHVRVLATGYQDAEDVPDMGAKAWRSLAVKMEKRWKQLRTGKQTGVFKRVCALCRQRAKEIGS